MSIGTELFYKICEHNKERYFINLDKSWFQNIEQDMYSTIEKFYNRYHKLPNLKTFSKWFGEEFTATEPFEYYAEEFKKTVLNIQFRNIIEEVNNLINNENIYIKKKYKSNNKRFKKQ